MKIKNNSLFVFVGILFLVFSCNEPKETYSAEEIVYGDSAIEFSVIKE